MGGLRFDISEVKCQGKLARIIQDAWADLESNTSQALFPGQLARTPLVKSRFTLYGPRESFFRIAGELQKLLGVNSVASFEPMDYVEIDRIRDESTEK